MSPFLGNQLSKTETKGDASIVESYTYDSIGRLESITAGNELTEYLYDANGNRSTQTVTTDGVQNLVIEYDYDLQNRLTEQISQKNGETEHKKYAYDNNGNLYSEMTSVVKNTAGLAENSIAKTGDVAQFPAVKLYRYNLSNQLVSYQDDNGIKASYTYNPDGMRSTKTVNDETTRYYYNGMYAVNEEQNGELTATNILGANGIIGRTAQGSTGYFVKNGHGDVIQARTTDGTILGNYDYDPWGNNTLADGTWNNPIRYAGEYTDEESGLIYLRARYYDSGIGRFISEDPAKDGLNWYVYCGNNPIAFVDPSGLEFTKEDRAYYESQIAIGNTDWAEEFKRLILAATEDYKAGAENKDILHMNDAHYRAVLYRQSCYNYVDAFDYTHGYGIIAVVGIHHIAVGGYHSSTIIMTTAENNLPDNIDEYYTAYGGKVKYATIGAGSVGGKLTSGVNREKDIILETKRDSIRFDVTYDIAKNLFRMEKYYRDNYDNVEYTTIPSLGTGYNCNSFTKGLLDAAGIALPRKPNAFVPGWEKPVPSYMFGE